MEFQLTHPGNNVGKFHEFSPLIVNWETILHEFSQRYDEVFEISSSKIHLDISSQVIDGVKGKVRFFSIIYIVISFCLRIRDSTIYFV